MLSTEEKKKKKPSLFPTSFSRTSLPSVSSLTLPIFLLPMSTNVLRVQIFYPVGSLITNFLGMDFHNVSQIGVLISYLRNPDFGRIWHLQNTTPFLYIKEYFKRENTSLTLFIVSIFYAPLFGNSPTTPNLKLCIEILAEDIFWGTH